MNLKYKEIKLENVLKQINKLNKKNENNNLTKIINDMINCKRKYHASFQDYYFFEMNTLNTLQRKSIITEGVNNNYISRYNIQKFIDPFIDAETFYNTFSKYMNREWLIINGKNKKEFLLFCQEHPKFIAVYKKRTKEIRKRIDTELYKLKDLYEELLENHVTIIEEEIEEHETLKKLHPESQNSITVVTLLGSIVASYLNIGNNNHYTNDFHFGGLVAPIDIETGIVKHSAMDINKNYYDRHPITKEKIKELQIPRYELIKELVDEICLEVPQIGYVSWQFIMDEEKIYLIKATAYPEHLIYAHKEIKIGLLPIFHQAEERKFEE